MKDNFQSHNAQSGSKQKKFLVPTLPEFLIYLFTSALLLALLNASSIWDYYRDNLASPPAGTSLIEQGSPRLQQLILDVSHSRFPLILFWLLTGCLVYILIWFMRSIYLSVRNDFVADGYVHPTNYNRTHFWETVLIRKLIFAGALVILVAYIPLGFRLLKVLAQDCYIEVTSFSPLNSLSGLLSMVLVGSFLLYALSLLVHTVFRCWRFMSSDL